MTSRRTVSRLSRILALVPFVLERGSVPVEEVMARFGYETRAELWEDLKIIMVCGRPEGLPDDLMYAEMEDDQVFIEAGDYFAAPPRLTSTEALGLLASGMAVLDMGEDNPILTSAVNKLAKVLVPDAGPAVSIDLEETPHVSALREAVADYRVVRISYLSVAKEETTERDIEPRTVFHTMGRWYVIAYCRMVDEQRTFRLDRIRSVETLPESFTPPETVPEAGVGYTPAEGDVSCVIDLTPIANWVLEYYPVEVVRRYQTKTRIRFWSTDAEVAARLLLRLGPTARLVEGDKVAERLSQLGTTLRALYS